MEYEVKQYFREVKLNDRVIKNIYNGFKRHEDIFNEFLNYIETRKYPTREEGAIEVLSYTAINIQDLAPHFNAAGVYNFLVMLRECPARAKEQIASNFRRE